LARHRFNISAAAESLERSQSGLSRQVKEIEAELGVQIFLRTRNKVIGLTPQGERILRTAQRILQELRILEQMGGEESAQEDGELRVATTHVHARYSRSRHSPAVSLASP
jgi:DNA-binding transcriptional LysR family regulator